MRSSATAFLVLLGSLVGIAAAQESLTLENSLEVAIEQSPEMVQARIDLERSRLQLQALKDAQKISADLQLTPLSYANDQNFDSPENTWYTSRTTQSSGELRLVQPLVWTDGTISLTDRISWQDAYSDLRDLRETSFSHRLSLQYTQPIFTYNRTKQQLRQQELSLENQTLSFAMRKLSLEISVASAYYDLLRRQMTSRIGREEYENQKKSLTIVENKVEAGLLAKEELYQARLNLATSEMDLKNTDVQFQNAAESFKRLLGMPLDRSVRLEDDIADLAVEVDEDKAIAHALKSRMELRQREIDIENAQFSVIQTAASNEFKGSISASVGLIGTDDDFVNAITEPSANQRVSLSLQIPLWDWGERKKRVKASKLSLQQTEISRDEERTDITLTIRQTCRTIRNLQNQIAIARQSIEYAELTYELNLERFKRGDLTSLEMDTYQTQLSQRKIDLTAALIGYKIELLNMKTLSLWDFEKNQSVVPEALGTGE